MAKKVLIAVSGLTPGSGLSRYVFSLCKILSENYTVEVLITHDTFNITYAKSELGKISSEIKLYSIGANKTVKKYLAALQLIRIIKPDIIVNNYNGLVQFLLPFINRKTRVLHILHSDTDDFYRIGSINGWKVNGWIAPTDAIASHFNEYTKRKYASRVVVIPHGVETAEYKERKNQCLEIIFAGVLYEHKGVKILPEIVKELQRLNINFHLTIVGEGILNDWLHKQFEIEIANGIVTMKGVVPHEEVYEKMSIADIFLYPTHLDAFGLVIAEAMMNGAVPVVTLLKGITDNLIEDKSDGFLIKQDDVKSFVGTIVNLAHNLELRKQLCRNANKKAVEVLSTDVMQRNYNEYFSKILR